MKIRAIFLFLILISTVIYPQRRHGAIPQLNGFYFQTVVLPSTSGDAFHLAYRVSYNRLVFVKDGDKFTTHFNFTVEAADSATSKVVREIVDKKLTVNTYAETEEDNHYLQGVIELSLQPGTYKISPIIFDINTGNENTLPPFSIRIKDKSSVFTPIIVEESSKECIEGLSEKLVNFEGNIPFSPKSFDMIIPVADTSVRKINLTILNNDSLVYSGVITEAAIREIKLTQCGDEIFLKDGKTKAATKNFILRKFSPGLTEGTVTIKMAIEQNGIASEEFQKNVVWYDKPRSLENTDFAIKILKYIASTAEINSLLDKSGKERFPALIKFWEKYDPTPKTVYNELMEEYYQRVDYSIKNFSTLATRNGAETDRGRVYIKYGKPGKIDRLFSDTKDVKEIWTYQDPNKKFVFVDKTGLGNYSLIESQ